MAAKRMGQQTSTIEKKRYRTRPGQVHAGSQQVNWHEQKAEDLWQYTIARVRALKDAQVRRRWELAIFQQLYCNYENFTGAAGMFAPSQYASSSPYRRLVVNVVKQCVDTATARIAKDKPRVFAMPCSSEDRIIKKAEKQTKFLDGAFLAAKVYENTEDQFRDGGIFGDGNIMLFERDGQIMSHTIKVDEVYIDPVLGMFNDPQEIHWQHPTPRTELLDKYPESAAAIEQARGSWRGDMAFMAEQDLVQTTYSWRKPTSKTSGDGRYAVCIAEKTLEAGEWTKDYFPILRWQWTPPTYGPYGMGIALELEGMQTAITSILRDVMKSIHLFAIPRVWLERMAGVSQHTLDNDTGTTNFYNGSPPVFSTPPAASPDIYQFLQWLIDACFKQIGLSQMSAQSEKPAGLNAAVAMRTYQDVETQRFAIVGQRWERHYCEIARVLLDMTAEIHKKGGKVSVKVPGRSFLETIDWKDIGLDQDMYDLQAYPTSILPRTPEGQIQTAQEIANSGFMPKEVLLQQLRIPNINAWIDEQTASRDNITMCLSRIRDKGKYVSPNPVADIDMCVRMAMSAYLRADLDESVAPARTELLLRFLNEAVSEQQRRQAMAQPPPQAAPGVPPGTAVAGQAPTPPPAPMAPQGSGPVQAAA